MFKNKIIYNFLKFVATKEVETKKCSPFFIAKASALGNLALAGLSSFGDGHFLAFVQRATVPRMPTVISQS
jgi:hypothetical protein